MSRKIILLLLVIGCATGFAHATVTVTSGNTDVLRPATSPDVSGVAGCTWDSPLFDDGHIYAKEDSYISACEGISLGWAPPEFADVSVVNTQHVLLTADPEGGAFSYLMENRFYGAATARASYGASIEAGFTQAVSRLTVTVAGITHSFDVSSANTRTKNLKADRTRIEDSFECFDVEYSYISGGGGILGKDETARLSVDVLSRIRWRGQHSFFFDVFAIDGYFGMDVKLSGTHN